MEDSAARELKRVLVDRRVHTPLVRVRVTCLICREYRALQRGGPHTDRDVVVLVKGLHAA